jgi:hypothetical protein
MSESQHLAHVLGRIHEREINTGGLERNQQADPGGIDGIHSPEVNHDCPSVLPTGRAQEGSFIATHNSASAMQNHDIVLIFDGYMQHIQSPESGLWIAPR